MNKKRQKASNKRQRPQPVELNGHFGKFHVLREGAGRYELRIDAEGRWYHEGIEIAREDIRKFFSRHLARRDDGEYYIQIGEDEAPVIVEDAPFLVVRVERNTHGGLTLLLSDGSTEPLAPETIMFKDSNVPYCMVRTNMEARFSRPAYYQLAEYICYDAEADRYCLCVNGEKFDLRVS
ncbi:MAG: DUF1285 domain-containing protein [Candidatus Abyssobacteria bacterium SURF_17]|jgi:hypothetical protein|uniref:DUF1285 domain-containing protein n=1 Tax=Candidatus Abyssobacteria bacterium SURF_17 TaxID=2093361 RepID=A0A419ETV2_9BACT|nr:MAG: DUF1285 domain-containing protein [Candidatus Abyssubacteria bacterium SURF_17]